MSILLKPDHFAFLKHKSIEHYSDKLATLAQANEELTFKDDNEIKDFMEAVVSEDFILGDTGKFYINMKQPVNIINGTHEEEFLQLEKRSSINPNTKLKEVDFNIAFETFENATLFDEDSVGDLPNSMKIYAAAEFRLPEIEAVKIYGDYDKWLDSYLEHDEMSSEESAVDTQSEDNDSLDEVKEPTETSETIENDEQIETIRSYKAIISDSMKQAEVSSKKGREIRKVKASVKAK